jgi:hypothetical protein
MPHTCIGALSHYYQSLTDYIASEQALRIVEVTAAGTAVYRSAWKPLKPLLLPTFIVIVTLMTITKFQKTEAFLFAHRMRPCLYPPAVKLRSPEPVKNGPDREAGLSEKEPYDPGEVGRS